MKKSKNKIVEYCSSLGEKCGVSTYTEMLSNAKNILAIKNLRKLKEVPSCLHVQHNFELVPLEELKEIINYCKKNKVKFYITMHSVFLTEKVGILSIIRGTFSYTGEKIINLIDKILFNKRYDLLNRIFDFRDRLTSILKIFKKNNKSKKLLGSWHPNLKDFLFIKKSQDLIIKNADKIIVHSKEAKKELLKQDAKNIGVVPHALEIFPISKKLFSEEDGKLHVGYFGFFNKDKALLDVIRACKKYTNLILHIYSSIRNKNFNSVYYKTILKEIKSKNWVIWNKEFLPLKEIVFNLSRCNVNIWYTRPLPYIATSGSIRQYLAAQRPIIASDNIMIRDIKPLLNIVPPNDIKSLVRAIGKHNKSIKKIKEYVTGHTWKKVKIVYDRKNKC